MRRIRQILFGLAPSVGVLLLAGCLRAPSMRSPGQYRLDSQSDRALLLPPNMESAVGTTQTTKLDLGGRLANASPSDNVARCSIQGSIFSLAPDSSGKRWEFRAPTPSGWNTPFIHEEADSEWEVFLRKLAKLASDECFAKGMGVDAIQRRLIETMSIPAGEVLRYYYSLGSFGFVDLHPGMQISVETTDIAAGKKRAIGALFSIEARSPVGVKLSLASSRKHLRGSEKMMVSEVLNKFAEYPLLRLFLEQGTTSSEPARHSILSGAKTQDDLNQMTDCVLKKGEHGCASAVPGGTRILISDGVISLLSTVTINGRSAFYAPGTTLSQVLEEKTAHKQGVLQTVILQRRFGDRYATVLFSRNREMASRLILINGDRIEF